MRATGVILAVALVATGGAASAQIDAAKAKTLMEKGACAACHTVDRKGVGPAYKDVAKKYKGDAAAAEALIGKVRKGSTGVWGPIPMPATGAEKLGDDELKQLIGWVLSQ